MLRMTASGAILYSNRQLLAMSTFSDLISEARYEIRKDSLNAIGCRFLMTTQRRLKETGGKPGATAYAEAVSCRLS